ncbi:uncharacterized protein MEPE_05154 [Melanopsichium pennsylvanicum]|uniref:Uncharacterized protein n=1 Tax=Melanopsichium pennsylvanicum TaxID=63383 RepID=A0AAJ5C716_9BASI|nr:uncharacterized protein MEPE_05154 [Melanopsichium pennsylvanicum]
MFYFSSERRADKVYHQPAAFDARSRYRLAYVAAALNGGAWAVDIRPPMLYETHRETVCACVCIA